MPTQISLVGLDSKSRYIISAFLNAGKSSVVRRPGMPARDCCNNSFFWKDRMEGDVTSISSALPYSRDHSNLRGRMIGFLKGNMGRVAPFHMSLVLLAVDIQEDSYYGRSSPRSSPRCPSSEFSPLPPRTPFPSLAAIDGGACFS